MCIYMHYIMLLFENVVFLLLAEWVTPVSIIISLIAGVLLLLTSTLVIICVWKRIKALRNVNDGGDHIPHADLDIAANRQHDEGLNLPHANAVDNLQGGNNGADNLADALAVPQDIEGEGHDAGNLPLAAAVLDNHQDGEHIDDDLLAIPAPVNQDGGQCVVEMEELADAAEEALPPPEEERFRERQNHQFAEPCTESSDTISVILRMPSSAQSGLCHSERMKHSLVQCLASSPTRSETSVCLCTCMCPL